ncbi:hypothetical protein ACFQHW_10105 [Lapidilactobacillus achengensis]|uniref:Uncharacterized protein n=1 Tax=Lapidilactobacillus achengensis TaxID=2486000 RepID=A0ABW1USX9_9LACO|nr:hypothetical protein [Lapidilactobacillus achengensis]
MNDENDFLMRQIKSFAEGLGYMLAKKKGAGADDVTIVFPDAETSLVSYQQALLQEIKTNNFDAAYQLLESWRANRISQRQYLRLASWLQERRFDGE